MNYVFLQILVWSSNEGNVMEDKVMGKKEKALETGTPRYQFQTAFYQLCGFGQSDLSWALDIWIQIAGFYWDSKVLL